MNAGSGRKMIGRYCLFRPLAAGGAATVHLGCLRSDGGFSRAVAIKKLHEHHASDARLTESLLSEARIASRIRHPHVVSVLDVVVEEGQPLVVLEYVEGESLSQLLGLTPEPLPLGVAVRIAVDALEGLHAAHEATSDQGVPLLVVHRDMSPQNIMVDVDGRSRIFDFGVAKALERSVATTKTGEFRGKLAYAAPEQINGRGVDRRTDLWAIGMVLWEAIAGRGLFTDSEPGAMVLAITDGEIPPPSTVRPCPPALDAIVGRALERDPDLRFSSAREMAVALEKTGLAADHRDVGRLLRKVARVRLEEKRQFVSEMEAELRREPESTVIDAVVNARVPEPAPRRRWLVLAVVALVATVGILTFARRVPPSARAPVSAVSAAPIVSSVASSPPPPPVAVALSSRPDASEGVPAPRPPSHGGMRRTKPGARPPAPIVSSAKAPVAAPLPASPTTADPLRPDERN